MSVKKQLIELSEEITLITSYAPDDYPERLRMTIDTHREDIQQLWKKILPMLKNREKADSVDNQLSAMFAAFAVGNRNLGRKIAWDLWNLPIRDLK